MSAWILRIGCALTLLGLGLLHLWLDPPYRALLWHEASMSPLLELFGVSWHQWVGDPETSRGIDRAASILGWLYLVLAAGALLPLRGRAVLIPTLVAAPLLLVLGWAGWAAHAYDLLWPLEFAARLALPLALVAAARQPAPGPWLRGALLLALSATFIGHASYALGWHPTPLAFREMLITVLGTGEGATTALLYVIAVQDVLLAAAVWWPRVRRPALLWMAAWGALTALARLSIYDSDFPAETLRPATAALLERGLHWALPLACWAWFRRSAHDVPEDPPCDRP